MLDRTKPLWIGDERFAVSRLWARAGAVTSAPSQPFSPRAGCHPHPGQSPCLTTGCWERKSRQSGRALPSGTLCPNQKRNSPGPEEEEAEPAGRFLGDAGAHLCEQDDTRPTRARYLGRRWREPWGNAHCSQEHDAAGNKYRRPLR